MSSPPLLVLQAVAIDTTNIVAKRKRRLDLISVPPRTRKLET